MNEWYAINNGTGITKIKNSDSALIEIDIVQEKFRLGAEIFSDSFVEPIQLMCSIVRIDREKIVPTPALQDLAQSSANGR